MSTCCFPQFTHNNNHEINRRYTVTYVLYKEYLKHIYIYVYDRDYNQITALIIYPRVGIKCTCVTSYFWKCKHERFLEQVMFKQSRFNFWTSINWDSTRRVLRDYVMPYCKELRNDSSKYTFDTTGQRDNECAFCLEPVDISSLWNVKCKRCNFIIHDTCWTQWYQVNQRMAIHCAICREMLSVTNCHYDPFYREYDFVLYSNTITPSLVHNNIYTTS